MKKLLSILLSLTMPLAFVSCGNSPEDIAASATGEPTSSSSGAASASPENGKILIAYFSRTGENYGVGYIKKGNTHVVADMIAEQAGGTLFEIKRVDPYPEEYDKCTAEAKTEKNENARPELTATVENFDEYDTIFLGYPCWWNDMPMPVYTFLESYDFSGKTVVPFCTHAGSGLSGTVGALREKLPASIVKDGLAVFGTTAQNNPDEARDAVISWLTASEIS